MFLSSDQRNGICQKPDYISRSKKPVYFECFRWIALIWKLYAAFVQWTLTILYNNNANATPLLFLVLKHWAKVFSCARLSSHFLLHTLQTINIFREAIFQSVNEAVQLFTAPLRSNNGIENANIDIHLETKLKLNIVYLNWTTSSLTLYRVPSVCTCDSSYGSQQMSCNLSILIVMHIWTLRDRETVQNHTFSMRWYITDTENAHCVIDSLADSAKCERQT